MRARDFEQIQQDGLVIGGFMFQAIDEISLEIGGEELKEQVREVAASDYGFPSPESFLLLNSIKPGAAKEVMERAHAIQTASQEAELAALHNPPRKLKQIGRGMLRLLG